MKNTGKKWSSSRSNTISRGTHSTISKSSMKKNGSANSSPDNCRNLAEQLYLQLVIGSPLVQTCQTTATVADLRLLGRIMAMVARQVPPRTDPYSHLHQDGPKSQAVYLTAVMATMEVVDRMPNHLEDRCEQPLPHVE